MRYALPHLHIYLLSIPGTRERGGENGYHSLRRAESRSSIRESSPPPPYRHIELGRPLPSTRSPEPKACIPFRNPGLGIPSKRRKSDSSNEPVLTSPPKYSQHSNFRRGPRSPSPYTPSPRNTSLTPTRSYLHSPSNYQSRHSSSHRRGSILSHSSSPSRSPSPFRQSEYSSSDCRRHIDTEDYSHGRGQENRSPSQYSYDRGLDSERLYKNLNSIANSADFNQQSGSSANWKSSRGKTDMNGYSHSRSDRDSRNPSPSSRGCDTPDRSLRSKTAKGNSTASYSQKSGEGRAKTDPHLLGDSWGGSAHSLCSPALSRGSSPLRRGQDSQLSRRVLEERSLSPEYRRPSYRNRSPSPRVRGHTSSQSSIESEACNISGGSDTAGLMEEYTVMADIPKTKPIYQKEGPRQRGKSLSYRIEVEQLPESSRYNGQRG